MLTGHRIRTRLDLVRPDIRGLITHETGGVQHLCDFVIGDRVLAGDFRNSRKPCWKAGVVVAKLSPITYSIQVELRGELVSWKRHADQFMEREADNRPEERIVDVSVPNHISSSLELNTCPSSVVGNEVAGI